jgi:hypothetical protein
MEEPREESKTVEINTMSVHVFPLGGDIDPVCALCNKPRSEIERDDAEAREITDNQRREYAWKWTARLFDVVKVAVMLAASAQAKRCWPLRCNRPIPWERQCWASPSCYEHEPREEDDDRQRRRLEREAEEICGIKGPKDWSR